MTLVKVYLCDRCYPKRRKPRRYRGKVVIRVEGSDSASVPLGWWVKQGPQHFCPECALEMNLPGIAAFHEYGLRA